MSCSHETADAIVKLLLDDSHVGEVHGVQRCWHEIPEQSNCRGCGESFKPKAVGRQFCSRSCYDSYLSRKRNGRPVAKRNREPRPTDGALGSGRPFDGEMRDFCVAQKGLLTALEVQSKILERFGVRVGISTVYRAWRRKNGQ